MANRRVVLPVPKRKKHTFETMGEDVVSFYASVPKHKPVNIVPKNPALEILAAISHEIWCFWSKQLSMREKLTPECLKRWKTLWKPYNKLTEAQKTTDRHFAKTYLDAVVRMRINGEI